MAEAGADLIIISRTQKDLDKVSKIIKKFKSKCISYACDLTNYTQIKKLSRQRAMDKGAKNLQKGLRMMPVQRSRDMRQNFKEKAKRHMIEAINNGRGSLAVKRYQQQLARMNKDSNVANYAGAVTQDDRAPEYVKGARV